MERSVSIGRIPTGRLGMWLLVVGELIIFGGLIACYLLYRLRYPEWEEAASHTNMLLGAINTFVLLTSSYTVVLAHKAAIHENVSKARTFLLITILLGLVFLGIKVVEYSEKIAAGYTIAGPSLFWSFYYTATGLHALHVIVGMIALFVIRQQIRSGPYLHRVELGALYWHMVDIIWIFLFPLFYIAK